MVRFPMVDPLLPHQEPQDERWFPNGYGNGRYLVYQMPVAHRKEVRKTLDHVTAISREQQDAENAGGILICIQEALKEKTKDQSSRR
jgi:hypothetical protein